MAKEFGPRCPNHGVVLVDRTRVQGSKGIGICPISGARFDFDEDYAEKNKKMKIDAMGNAYYDADWKVEGND